MIRHNTEHFLCILFPIAFWAYLYTDTVIEAKRGSQLAQSKNWVNCPGRDFSSQMVWLLFRLFFFCLFVFYGNKFSVWLFSPCGFLFLFLFCPLIFFYCIVFFNSTILYWFCHISTWIHHRYTRVPHPEPSSLLPPSTIPLGRPSAPAPSIQYRSSNLDWPIIQSEVNQKEKHQYSILMHIYGI